MLLLKGHSQLWDRADLDTSFLTLKRVYLKPISYPESSGSLVSGLVARRDSGEMEFFPQKSGVPVVVRMLSFIKTEVNATQIEKLVCYIASARRVARISKTFIRLSHDRIALRCLSRRFDCNTATTTAIIYFLARGLERFSITCELWSLRPNQRLRFTLPSLS